MNYNQQLIDFINQYYNGNIRKCAIACNIEYSSLYKYFHNTLVIGLKAAKNIEDKIFEKTGMRIFAPDNYLEPIHSAIVEIPVHEATMSAGLRDHEPTFDVLTEEKVFLTESELHELQLKRENLQAFKVRGDSMQYTINDGARVVVDRKQCDIIDNRVYAITYGSEFLARVKRLRKNAKGLLIASDNHAYDDELIEYDSNILIKIIGRVVFVVNKL
ncbi:MAG: hypothetical protein K2Y14_12900 [Burkholderiales bacterium]|nr:hypothetical protein [Burkholderiales bacterium]